MYKRNIYKSLAEWKDNDYRRPVLIRGARQIGKTFVVEQFAKKEFSSSVTLNFERNPEYRDIFETFDPVEIIERISLYTGKSITSGKTLLFLDEIQDCPKAITALRYFYEEMPELHVVGAGSLLEFSLQSANFKMPVGRVQYLYMYPLSFAEFLDAIGEKALSKFIGTYSNMGNIPESLHDKLIELTQKYFIIGGMPAVINEYIRTRDIVKCRHVQTSIIDTFIDDFAKYTRESKFPYLKTVFNSVPSMIGKKIIYARIDNNVKSRELKEAVELLETAGILIKSKRTSGSGLPLKSGIKENNYKLLFLDIGLFHSISGVYGEIIKEKDINVIFKGSVAEQFVGQEIICAQNPHSKSELYYWAREAKNSNAEIDYLIESSGAIIPVEVKSGPKGKLKSMIFFLENYNLPQGVKISQAAFNNESNILSLPFYAVRAYVKTIDNKEQEAVS